MSPAVRDRALEVIQALKVAYLDHQIENVRLVVSRREALEFRNWLDYNRGYRESIKSVAPFPVPGKRWGVFYGLEVWIKEEP